jgi:hypothetical protein
MKAQTAFTFGLTRSICDRNAAITSDAETSLSRIIRARSTAFLKQSSVIAVYPRKINHEETKSTKLFPGLSSRSSFLRG